MSGEATLSGRCHCGAVRLELAAPTLFASHCHCETCRRVHGAPFVTWTAVPRDRLRVDGAPTWYPSSPGVRRGFCGRCGTPLLFVGDDAPDRVYVPVAVLDRLDRPVEGHVSFEERAPWLVGAATLQCFRGKSQDELPGFSADPERTG